MIFLKRPDSVRGGPAVWCDRFSAMVQERGLQLGSSLNQNWQAALFVLSTAGLAEALRKGRLVGFRVANAYLPAWFLASGKQMQPIHHASNAATAYGLQNANQVIYQSSWAKQQLDHALYERLADYRIIRNGIDLEKFAPPAIKQPGMPVIGSVGIFRYRYRLETIFKVSKELSFEHKLLLVGSLDGESKQVMDEFTRDPLLKSRLIYHDHLHPARLVAYYQQMDLFIHPVIGDAGPNVVAEALACGVPVVAPDYGGSIEMIGAGGVSFHCQPWVYDDAFIDAMKTAVEKAITNQDSLAVAARRQAEEQLDASKMVDQYLDVLGLPRYILRTEAQKTTLVPPWRTLGSQLISKPRFYRAALLRKINQVHLRPAARPKNPKPRIAFTLFDFQTGGIENWLYRLALKLKSNYDFYFIATQVPQALPRYHQVGTCTFQPDASHLTHFLTENRIDILQVHNERWPIDAGLAAGVPHIIERLGGRRSWRRVPKFGLDMVIASSKLAAATIQDMLGPGRVRVIYNGIDLDLIDSTPVTRLFSEDALILGRTSRFGRGQNLPLLVQAVEKLLPRWPELRLVLVGGDSPLPGATSVSGELQQLVKDKRLEQIVTLPGMVENALPYTLGFDIATCVSNDEGIPNSLIEAMACRKPVISTAVGAVSELIQDGVNGLLIPPNDVTALCQAIELLLVRCEFRDQLASAARKTVEASFNLNDSARLYSQAYQELIEAE